MINMVDFEVYLQGGSPWGFRLQGGREFRMPIRIAKVEPGGKAHNGGIQVGDQLTEIDGVNTENMYHTEALTAVKRAQYSLSLLLTRPEKDENSNSIQSVGLTPEATNTKVSLVIGPKRSVSSDRINKSTEDIPNTDIPHGQTYMKKFIRGTGADEEPPLDRSDSATLPRNLRRRAEDDNYTHPDYSSKSLPRKKENGYTHPDYSSKSLPRARTKSTSDAPSKAPSWYKNMYKEMHTSMEKESHLSKLLASDAKRGAFRKYDGITSPHTQRSTDCYNVNQSATFEDAPRRLQGGGRSIANHPNRKSLPNIHAASFNFMTDYNKANNTESFNKPDSSNKPRGPHSPKWETLIPAPDDPPDLLMNKVEVPKPINIQVEYNNPPDFLELRKQEIKNRELENERETIRQQREKERLAGEERLLEQKTRDFIRIEEEKRRLQLKEEELRLKEELMLKHEEEQEEQRLLRLKEINLKRLEEEERQLKLKEEEIRRREEEEKRLLRLKEEELLRKEEMLKKQERELEARRFQRIQEDERKHRELEEKRLLRLREEEDIKRQEIEAERLRKLKEEDERRKEEERLRMLKEAEENRLRALEEERLRQLKEEEELQRKLEEERLKLLKEEEDRKQKELEEERIRKLKEEEELQRKLEEERLRELKEAEEKRLKLLQEKEEQERLELKRRAEELERKEREELENLRLKEEELKRKEELLLKMEAEQLEKQRLLEESLQPTIPPYGRAKYSFHPQGPGELEFKKGEIISVLAAVDENWIEGEHKGNIGIFPVSYVELIESLPGEPVPEIKPVIEIPVETVPEKEALDSKYFEPKGEPLVVATSPEEPEIIGSDAPLVNGTSEIVVPEEKEPEPEIVPEEVQEEEAVLPHIEEGSATARYTFKAETDSELSFKKGDAIVLLKRVDDNWYEGELNGHIGILPVNYVKVAKEPVVIEPEPVPEPVPEPEPAPVVESTPNFAEILCDPIPASVLKPRKVEDRKPSAEMIIDEVLTAHENDKKAKENPSLVNGFDHANGSGSELDDLIGKGEPHKAIFKYNPTNEDEVELKVGDIVHVLEKCDDGWFIGTSQRTGQFGTFPGNYVNAV